MRSINERSENEQTPPLEGTAYRELRVLEEMDGTAEISQRRLSSQLGVALGVTNLLVKKLAKQGYIRVTQLGWKRWAYVVTPRGMARKIHLTKAYVERFIDHYSRVRALLREDLRDQGFTPTTQVAVVGTTEISELAFLALRDIGATNIDVYAINPVRQEFLGITVQDLNFLAPSKYGFVVLTQSNDENGLRESLLSNGVLESQIVELFRVPDGAQATTDIDSELGTN